MNGVYTNLRGMRFRCTVLTWNGEHMSVMCGNTYIPDVHISRVEIEVVSVLEEVCERIRREEEAKRDEREAA